MNPSEEQPDGSAYDSKQKQSQKCPPDQKSDKERIDSAAAVQNAVEGTEDHRDFSVRFPKKQRAQRRTQRHRNNGGKAERDAHRNGKLHVDASDHAAVKCKRCIAGDGHKRGRDDRAGDLPHAFQSRLSGRKSFPLHQRLAVLHDHDGVVAEGPDDENQPEHRQNVDAVIQCIEKRKGAEQSDRNRDRGNQCRPPVLQEKPGDQNHEQKRGNQRGHNFRHGHLDELGRIVGDNTADALREHLVPFLKFRLDPVDRLQRIGFRRAVNAQTDRFPAVEQTFPRIGARTDFHFRNVLHAHDAAVLVMPDDNVSEFLRRHEPSLDIQFVIDVMIGMLRSDGSRRGLNVLRLHGCGDVRGGNAEPRHAQRIQPQTHGILP